jgi:hypothetical protein
MVFVLFIIYTSPPLATILLSMVSVSCIQPLSEIVLFILFLEEGKEWERQTEQTPYVTFVIAYCYIRSILLLVIVINFLFCLIYDYLI